VPLPNHPAPQAGPGETRALYTPDGRALLYVAGWGADRAVLRVDLAARRVTASAALGRRGERAAGPLDRLRGALVGTAEAKENLPAPAVLSPDGRTLYAAVQRVGERVTDPSGLTRTEHGDGILALDADGLAPRAHLLAGRELWGDLAVSPDGRRLYATDRATETLFVLDAATGAELARWTGFARSTEAIERVVAPDGG
jgi:DNA-binding beta-propeller fold protein YncE